MQSKDTVLQAIQVNDLAYSKQLVKKSLYYSNIIVWTVIFIYPMFGVLDYIYANALFQILFLAKIVSVFVIFLVYDITQRVGKWPLLPLHVTFTLISVNAALICNLVDFDVAPIFFLLYAALFMLFNLAVFWPASYSFGHFFGCLLYIAIAYQILNTISVEVFLTQGAGLFIMTGFFSCFIPVARYGIIQRNTLSELRIKNTTSQLRVLHGELVDKNVQVEAANTRLTELVMQQDTFLMLVKEDIERFIGAINDAAHRLRIQGTSNLADTVLNVQAINQNVMRLEQLVEIFPNENMAPSSHVVLDLQFVDIHHSLLGVGKCMESLFALYNVKLVVDHQQLNYKLDQLYFDQLLFNLFANCLKFSETNSTINCSLTSVGEHAELQVVCLPSALVDVETDLIVQDTATVQSLQKGLGPGFYVAKLLAERMGNQLTYHKNNDFVYYILRFGAAQIK
ncbi:hypothetical protein ACJVDH_21075 [Pedobacter sp. AW1-32]|uniref:hypothetical protein n=1 Tax=Pedobacter sp. AW1-32 TaxID=3383026 RepID=UPI003FEF71BA